MNALPPIIDNVKPLLNEIARKHKVDKLYLFGSAANGRMGEESDIDLLVSFKDMPLLEFADNFFDLQEELQELFTQKIDLVVEQSIQNQYLIKSISKSKVPIYG